MYDFLNFATTTTISIASLSVAVLAGLPQIRQSWKSKEVRALREKARIQRRGFLKASLIIVASTATWTVLKFTPLYDHIKRGFFYVLPRGKLLVVNKKSGVIHHKVLCADHLPAEESNSPIYSLAANSRFHRTKKVAILTDLTESVSAEDAIELLMLSVNDNPTSVHIYDKLVKLLGKIKRYESIHILLENTEQRLKSEIQFFDENSRKHKEYNKAIKHIVLQKRKANERARIAALRI